MNNPTRPNTELLLANFLGRIVKEEQANVLVLVNSNPSREHMFRTMRHYMLDHGATILDKSRKFTLGNVRITFAVYDPSNVYDFSGQQYSHVVSRPIPEQREQNYDPIRALIRTPSAHKYTTPTGWHYLE